MPNKLVFTLFILAASLASSAQQGAMAAPRPAQPASTIAPLPKEPAKMAALINASYYRADELASIDCGISMDWAALFANLKQTPPVDRMAALQGLKVHSRAVRGKAAEVTFDWAGGPVDGKEQIEDGLKQTLTGFYQMYWPLLATPLIKGAAELDKIEPQPDGSSLVYTAGGVDHLIITVDDKGHPAHWVLDTPTLKGTIDPVFIPSPNPTPGDLSRVSSLSVLEQVGASSMNVKMDMDYQGIDKFYVPRNVSFGLVGAYSLKMEFTGCTVTNGSPAP